MWRWLISIVFASAMAAGCHGHGDESCAGMTGHSHSDECTTCTGDEDPYNATLTGDGEDLTIELLEAVPNPHTNGNNTLRVRVLDAGGSPVEGADFTKVEPFATNQGHGTPLVPVVAELGAGEYEITEINYIHKGTWELRIDVDEGGTADSFNFFFCIDEVPET